MSFYSTNSADAEVPAFSPLAGPSAAQEQYQANQLRLVGFIHQTKHLLSQVDRLAHPDKPVRLSYPTSSSSASASAAASAHEPIPENDNDNDASEDVDDCRSEFGTAATRRRAGTGTGTGRHSPTSGTNATRHTRSSSSSSSSSSSPVPPPTAPGLFKVLTLDVPTSPRTGTILLPSDALSGLLRTKLADLKTHLGTLESRVQDRTSRILVTGDLNAGKSTFVNALLRRAVVPTDQQPLTNVFTEVVDAKHNRKHPGREEVHAVVDPSDPHGTVDVLPVEALERLVGEPEPYGMIKVFVREEAEHPAAQGPGSPTIRASESSMSLAAAAVAAHHQQQEAHDKDDDLNSSVLVGSADVDVRLIDSPGLNRDVWKTMSIFSQQAEIDVIVFVVSAENHFTLSSREFLAKAGQEKAYIFVVVNKFDSIRDKDRCAKVILQQIEQLSPHTHALQDKLVHFVSAEAMLLEASHLGRYSRGELDVLQFLHVERALKEFTLEKRAVSKLHPAKRFLESLLVDVEVLVEYNVRKAQEQVAGIRGELAQLRPLEQELDAHRAQTLRALEKELGVAANKASDAVQSQMAAGKLADRLTKRAVGVEWRGVRHALAYVRDVHAALVAALAEDVNVAQDVAERAMREAWQNMDKMHQGWVGKVAAAAALDAEPSVPLAPLQVAGTSLIKLYPITSGIGGVGQQAGLVLTPRSLLFPHMPAAPALHVPVLLSRQALANPHQAFLDTWMHLTSRIASLSWSDVTPLAIVDKLGGTATASSLALTGCSFVTSSVLATRSVGGDIMSLGMRVGLKRVAIITLVGVATVGSLSAYHWLVTLPSHLPESMARAALEQVHAAQYPQMLAAHLSTTARVALTRTVAEAQTKMDHGLAKVKSQQERLAQRVELVEAAVDEMEAVKQRAELVRVQVAAVAVEDRIVGKLAHMPRVRA